MHEGPISISESDLPQLIAILNQVFRSEGGDMAQDYPRHLGLNNRDMVRVIKDDGQIVSHVATSIRPVSLGGIQTAVAGIGAVATLPEARGKGYASMLMADAVERSVAAGADIMLISGDEGIYKRMHAVECGRFSEIYIEKENFTSINSPFETSQVSHTQLEDIVRLRQELSIRYLLPLEDIQALFQCKWVMDKSSEWWIVKDENQIIGFGVIHKDGSDIHLLDWVGASEALIELTNHCFYHLNGDRLIFITPDLSTLPFGWRNWVRCEVPFDGTILVIQAERLLQRAEAYIQERIGETLWDKVNLKAEAQRVTFQFENESASFDNGGELAQLFFGQVEGDIIAEKTEANGQLCVVLKKIFPIPLVWYGLGYV
ncbi:MAG: GNAT family N-acetyltransferase [Candidatus Hinthialibacter antarcticus]|nr:GNAT family N-acetyltransferase [Candidatus Hinthialibacter antarcticus]